MPDIMDIPNNLYRATNPLIGEVIENKFIAPEEPFERQVCHIVIRYQDPNFRYIPGQSVGVIPPGADPKTGKPQQLRLYSVASDRKGDLGDGLTVSLCVVRHFWDNEKTGEKNIAGVCSNYLCDLKVGDKVKLTGPVGRHFLIPPDFKDRDFIFLSTGTGIAPFRGMLKELFEGGYRGSCWHIFGTQFKDRVLYDGEIKPYEKHPNFHYLTAVSREEVNPMPEHVPTRQNRMYVQVKMAQHERALIPAVAKPSSLLYICGLKGMEAGILPVIDSWGRELGQGENWSQTLKAQRRLLLEVY